MTNQISNILESDVTEANDKMLGKDTSNIKKNNEVFTLILFIIFIIGLFAFLEEKRHKEKKKLKIKYDNGETKEIDLSISETDIEKALKTLKSK